MIVSKNHLLKCIPAQYAAHCSSTQWSPSIFSIIISSHIKIILTSKTFEQLFHEPRSLTEADSQSNKQPKFFPVELSSENHILWDYQPTVHAIEEFSERTQKSYNHQSEKVCEQRQAVISCTIWIQNLYSIINKSNRTGTTKSNLGTTKLTTLNDKLES